MADLQESRVRENRARSRPLQLSSPDAVPTLRSQIKDPFWTLTSFISVREGGGGHAFLFIIFLCTKVSPFCKYCVTLSVKHFKR